MARAEAASASVRSDSIKGLAQSIAKPAYRRLLTAEPVLRRAVPSLIVAFLVTVGIGAVIQVNDRHRQAVLAALEDIDAIADVALDQIEGPHRRAAALASWRSDTVLTVTLFATTGFVLLILGFAFHWQSLRAREADVIFDTVRSRIDTALNRGRCGLWDWDLARGRIFWSYSMFD